MALGTSPEIACQASNHACHSGKLLVVAVRMKASAIDLDCTPWCLGRRHHALTGNAVCASAEMELAVGVHAWLTRTLGGETELVVSAGRGGRLDGDLCDGLRDRYGADHLRLV
jgi:hypothetical protein